MINYYDVLGIRPEAKPEEIKRSYRRLAKEYHPDRHPGRTKWAEDQFRSIIRAYDVLRDPTRRSEHDRELQKVKQLHEREPADPYKESLESRPEDPTANARLILYELLNENDDEAVRLYEAFLQREPDFELSEWLDTKDWLDCEFLLGEAYEKNGKWREALRFYEHVYAEEKDDPQRYFLDLVKEKIRDIYSKRLARRSPPLQAVAIYQKVLNLGIQKKTEAYIHKKIAEAFHKAGQLDKARDHLETAFRLEPKLKGAQKICEKLGVSPQRPGRSRRRAKSNVEEEPVMVGGTD
jgi:curved DNA-binding protein CbpA